MASTISTSLSTAFSNAFSLPTSTKWKWTNVHLPQPLVHSVTIAYGGTSNSTMGSSTLSPLLMCTFISISASFRDRKSYSIFDFTLKRLMSEIFTLEINTEPFLLSTVALTRSESLPRTSTRWFIARWIPTRPLRKNMPRIGTLNYCVHSCEIILQLPVDVVSSSATLLFFILWVDLLLLTIFSLCWLVLLLLSTIRAVAQFAILSSLPLLLLSFLLLLRRLLICFAFLLFLRFILLFPSY